MFIVSTKLGAKQDYVIQIGKSIYSYYSDVVYLYSEKGVSSTHVNELQTYNTFLTVSEVFFCDVCCASFGFKSKFERHIYTSKHKQRAFLSSFDPDGVGDDVAPYPELDVIEHSLVGSPHGDDNPLKSVDEVKLSLHYLKS